MEISHCKEKSTILIFLFIVFTLVTSQEIFSSKKGPFLIKKIIPSHYEKDQKFLPLKKIHAIPTNFSKDYFFARPTELVVNENGNIYIYDDLLNKILKFKPNFKFNMAFGKVGKGPGDFSPPRRYKSLGVHKDKIIVSDFDQKKLIIFKENGKFIQEVKFPSHIRYAFPIITFRTISLEDVKFLDPKDKRVKYLRKKQFHVTDQVNYIVTAFTKNSINYIGKCNSNFHNVKHYFFESAYFPFIVHKPDLNRGSYTVPDFANTSVQLIPETQTTLIYVANSSTLTVFNPNNTEDTFDVIPNAELKSFKKSVLKLKEKLKSNNFYKAFFQRFFIDQDNWEFLYFTGRSGYGDDKKYLLYKYDLEGNLINIFYHYEKHRANFMAKKNGYFYSIDHLNDEIKIFKEKKNE